jgi:hypothetical protein
MAGLADAAAELEALAFRLRRAGTRSAAPGVTRGHARRVEPVQDQIRAGLLPHLPNPYAAALDETCASASTSARATRDPGVAVRARPGQGPEAPAAWTPGSSTTPIRLAQHWYAQEVQPGWFIGARPRQPGRGSAPGSRRALEDVADKAVKGG